MNSVAHYVKSVKARIAGRVFTYDGRLHLVLDADESTGMARLSCRYDQQTDILYMPVAEVLLRLEEECVRHDQSMVDDGR